MVREGLLLIPASSPMVSDSGWSYSLCSESNCTTYLGHIAENVGKPVVSQLVGR